MTPFSISDSDLQNLVVGDWRAKWSEVLVASKIFCCPSFIEFQLFKLSSFLVVVLVLSTSIFKYSWVERCFINTTNDEQPDWKRFRR